MRSEFTLDLCFIREQVPNDDFAHAVEKQLEILFLGKAHWYTEVKQENHLDVAVAEIKGMSKWGKEDDALTYLEEQATPQFWEWMQGCRIKVEVKENVECSHCGKN